MSRASYLFTSESVSEGHPDKVCDRISDEVVDAFLAAEPQARVACETLVTTNRIILAGEVRGPESVVASLCACQPAQRARHRDPAVRSKPSLHAKSARLACAVL